MPRWTSGQEARRAGGETGKLLSESGGGLKKVCAGKDGRGRGQGWLGSSPVGRFDNVDWKGLYLNRVGSWLSVGYRALGVGRSEQHGISFKSPR